MSSSVKNLLSYGKLLLSLSPINCVIVQSESAPSVGSPLFCLPMRVPRWRWGRSPPHSGFELWVQFKIRPFWSGWCLVSGRSKARPWEYQGRRHLLRGGRATEEKLSRLRPSLTETRRAMGESLPKGAEWSWTVWRDAVQVVPDRLKNQHSPDE